MMEYRLFIICSLGGEEGFRPFFCLCFFSVFLLVVLTQHEEITKVGFFFFYNEFLYRFEAVMIGAGTVEPAVEAAVQGLSALGAERMGPYRQQWVDCCMAVMTCFHVQNSSCFPYLAISPSA